MVVWQLKGSVKEPNMFHNLKQKITRKASDAAEYNELFGSFTRDRHARRINVILWTSYAPSCMTISCERTEQHVVIGFGEPAAVD